MALINENQNYGLPYRFSLTETGAFKLIGGGTKAQDGLAMMLTFIGWHRTYYPDFSPDVLWLLQKPTSMVESFKTVILSRFVRAINKYIPTINVEKINIQYDYTDRKKFGTAIQYTYNLEPENTIKTVSFIG